VIRRLSDVYVYKLIPPRPSFDQDMRPEEAAIMARHAEYWGALIEERGRILVYGPVRDDTGSWGLGVLEADSEEEVRALAAEDPALTSGLAKIEIGKMAVAVVPTSNLRPDSVPA
jgi:uncharacterized protein